MIFSCISYQEDTTLQIKGTDEGNLTWTKPSKSKASIRLQHGQWILESGVPEPAAAPSGAAG